MKFFCIFIRSNNPWIGKVQWQIRRFLYSLYQKPLYLSICPTVLFGKVKNRCGRFAPHAGVQHRRKSGVTSILRSKALAQGRFIRPEQVQSPKGERPKGTNPAKEPRPMGRGSFAGFVPFGRSPFGDCTCSGRMNRPCAKALLRKILVTPDFRRCWTPACGANLPHLFFTFPKRTVGQIDKYSGFWYNEYKKRRICHCTLPIQGLLLRIKMQKNFTHG